MQNGQTHKYRLNFLSQNNSECSKNLFQLETLEFWPPDYGVCIRSTHAYGLAHGFHFFLYDHAAASECHGNCSHNSKPHH